MKLFQLFLSIFLYSCLHIAQAGEAPVIPQKKAPQGAPNVVVVLLDDVGFGAASTFGGGINTPALDSLANEGLRYNRFHTTAICSPTRASLLTGRDPHNAGVGSVLNVVNSYPGYRGVLKQETATIAEILRQNGYNTAAFGKWHLTPDWEISPAVHSIAGQPERALRSSMALSVAKPISTSPRSTREQPPSDAPMLRIII